jgi:hypothetical protein
MGLYEEAILNIVEVVFGQNEQKILKWLQSHIILCIFENFQERR